MERRSNPAGTEVNEACIGRGGRLDYDRVLGFERTAEPNRAKGAVMWGRSVGERFHSGDSGLAWKASGMCRERGRNMQTGSGESYRSVDGFHGGSRLHGRTEYRPVDTQAIRRSREVPIRLEVA